ASTAAFLAAVLACGQTGPVAAGASPGNAPGPIRIASIIDLEGPFRVLGRPLRKGLAAALRDRIVDGRNVELLIRSDRYDWIQTADRVRELLEFEPVAMVANLGAPGAEVALPLLEFVGVPAIAFHTGADIVFENQPGAVKLMPSYADEAAFLITEAIAGGVQPNQVCAMVRDDVTGVVLLHGMARGLRGHVESESAVLAIEALLEAFENEGLRNEIGPVGVFNFENVSIVPGYRSLKRWEKMQDTRCKLVLMIAGHQILGRFAFFARYKGEDWILAGSTTIASAEKAALEMRQVGYADRLILSRFVPKADGGDALTSRAKTLLGPDLNESSLYGFIAGELVLHMLDEADGDYSLDGLLATLGHSPVVVGGVRMDFRDGRSGLSAIQLNHLTDQGWKSVTKSTWKEWR
ncbi:MAG: ABC transporter substrate-binding protein, partial [Gammaproteobacteria bacterium]